MRKTEDIMGMPISVEVVGVKSDEPLEKTFKYFHSVDETFSTYKPESEISRINRGELAPPSYSSEMREVLRLCEETKRASEGYFDIKTPQGVLDPSGLVKGWAIRNAANLLERLGYQDFYVEAGGDIQTKGKNAEGEEWRIGIRNPFNRYEIIKILFPRNHGIATSGTAVRGAHIYNPHTSMSVKGSFASLTVIGPDVYEADRFATAAFAMRKPGLMFLENLEGFEAYAVEEDGVATFTSGFDAYL